MQQADRPVTSAPGGDGSLRLRALLAYEGSAYHGWAKQRGLPTVEQSLLAVLAVLLPEGQGSLTCAGRTDAGVHARGQVVHFDAPADTDVDRLLRGMNALLPSDIRLRELSVAPPAFNARFAALWRRYRYRLTDGVPDPLTRRHVLAVPRRLDVAAMDQAIQPLVGEHDFRSFCKPRPNATTIRGVQACSWRRSGEEIVLDITADAFCHSMVRSIVGASLLVGGGQRPVRWLDGLLSSPSRQDAAPVAPALGLVLIEVGYPPPEDLAAQVRRSRRTRSAVAPGHPAAEPEHH